ncbi:MAG: GGDEF domain-containing protein [Synechococcaceae cyanobacterium RL_1_2]|nr:GGDEF domain-containing protein [Synechococcaceae cyanobacterium RL_1_2]
MANRRRFDQFFNQEWRRCSREEQSLSLILGDIDHFKLFNDNYGHQEGDRCLKEVAQTLEACIKRPGDLVARYGGEEFVIVLPNTTKEGAIHFAQTIRQAIHHLNVPHHYSLTSDRVTMSLGLSSVVPTPGANYLDFLACVGSSPL